MTTPSSILVSAAFNGDLSEVVRLAREGTDLDAADEVGLTPLSAAIEGGHRAVVKRLLTLGANPNARGVNGWTPLHTVVDLLLDAHRQGTNYAERDVLCKTLIALLIDAGADIDLADARGRSPRSILASSDLEIALELQRSMPALRRVLPKTE